MQSNISQTAPAVNYAPNGYALKPTGQMYTRAEIVTDPNYPALLPKFVDATNPLPYWRRMTGQELTEERKRIDAEQENPCEDCGDDSRVEAEHISNRYFRGIKVTCLNCGTITAELDDPE